MVFPCAYGQWAGGIMLEMELQWPCSAQGHHTLPSRPSKSLAALTHPTPPHAKASWTSASGTRDPRTAPQPCAQSSWGMEQSLGTVGAAPSQVSPGHCPGCADAPGGLSAFPHLCPPQGAGLALSLQGKVGCVLSLGHEPQSQHFGAGFPPLTPTYCMT